MIINGLQKLTLLDYPEHTACTVFLAGCNFRCPFCHNSEILNLATAQPLMDEKELLAFLQKRQGLLDGVCITGGEPTLRNDLPELFREIKKLGFKTKLDTNGTNPAMIKKLVDETIVDYIAMDIKAAPDNYENLAGVGVDMDAIKESAHYIMFCGIDYEFRTTVVKGLHQAKDFEAIGQWLKNARAYYLQPFVNRDTVLQKNLTAPTDEELNTYLNVIKKYINNSFIRGR